MVILDGEDDFVNMLRHVLGVLGMTSEVVRHEDYVAGRLDGFDLVIVGPGPGDPRDGDDPKMARPARGGRRAARARAAVPRGLPRAPGAVPPARASRSTYKDIVFQGTQSPVVDRRPDRAGRLLQHLRRPGRRRVAAGGVEVEADPATGDIHHLVGPHYRGIQFHAESILTEHGYDLMHDLVPDLLATPSRLIRKCPSARQPNSRLEARRLRHRRPASSGR